MKRRESRWAGPRPAAKTSAPIVPKTEAELRASFARLQAPEFPKAVSVKVDPKVVYLENRTFDHAAALLPRNLASGERKVSALALAYDKVFTDGVGNSELYKYGCFRDSLSLDDPLCLYCDFLNNILGRKSSGTCRFWEALDGLRFEVTLPTTYVADGLTESMERGDVDGASACFAILESSHQQLGGKTVNVISKAVLFYASITPVTPLMDVRRGTASIIAEAHRQGRIEGKRQARAKFEERMQSMQNAMNQRRPYAVQ